MTINPHKQEIKNVFDIMKNLITVILATIFFLSCSSDDTNSSDVSSDSQLNGTSWIGTGETVSERSITFTSEMEYTYVEPGQGGTIMGTYIFSSSSNSGLITDDFGSVPFTINNDLLILDYDEGTAGYMDTEGIETFVQN